MISPGIRQEKSIVVPKRMVGMFMTRTAELIFRRITGTASAVFLPFRNGKYDQQKAKEAVFIVEENPCIHGKQQKAEDEHRHSSKQEYDDFE